jgi:hypothetical protein
MSKKRPSRATKTKRKAEDNDPTSPGNKLPFRAACVIVARKYCDTFGFWRDCRYKPCRSARRRIGDVGTCLNKRWYSLSYAVRLAAHGQMQAEVPPKADRWLRLAHRYPPDTLCVLLSSDRLKAKVPRRTGMQTGTQAEVKNDVGS